MTLLRFNLQAALVGALCLLCDLAQAGSTPRLRPIAVVVGANAPPPGRQPLRYALSDAQLMADTLLRVGGFAPADIHTLLEPQPSEILTALDNLARETRSAEQEALLVFYYSGHSDGQLVFPHGEPLSLTELRAHFEHAAARVRIAIVDTCRGGSWTGTKGLTIGPPLDALELLNVNTEGTALLSSSSGLENAHEAAALNGSFFTHHIAAGLLGAADESGDGNVTLQEVFEYAKERTVRDSARMALTTQHPSFEIELHGRQDIVLARLASGQSQLQLTQTHALEVVQIQSGLSVIETSRGPGTVRLALPPGQYVVRRVSEGHVYSKAIDVTRGSAVHLDESELQLSDGERLALKGWSPPAPPPSTQSTLPRNAWELRLALGTSTGRPRSFGSMLYDSGGDPSDTIERSLAGVLAFTYGITDRLSWSVPVPAFAYRLGEGGSFEWIPRAGLTAIGYSSIDGFIGTLDAGLAARLWLRPGLSLLANASGDWSFGTDQRERLLGLHASLGVHWVIDQRVALALGAGWAGNAKVSEATPGPLDTPAQPDSELVFGAVQTLAYRPVPLVEVFLVPELALALDAYASWGIDLHTGDVRDRYLAGFTWLF
jgi:Caspase domain